MLKRLVEAALNNCWTVVFLTGIFIAGGTWVALNIPVEAFPDLTNVVSAK